MKAPDHAVVCSLAAEAVRKYLAFSHVSGLLYTKLDVGHPSRSRSSVFNLSVSFSLNEPGTQDRASNLENLLYRLQQSMKLNMQPTFTTARSSLLLVNDNDECRVRTLTLRGFFFKLRNQQVAAAKPSN